MQSTVVSVSQSLMDQPSGSFQLLPVSSGSAGALARSAAPRRRFARRMENVTDVMGSRFLRACSVRLQQIFDERHRLVDGRGSAGDQSGRHDDVGPPRQMVPDPQLFDGPFQTEVSAPDGTKPDVMQPGVDGKERFFIEAKFHASLTPDPPGAYLKQSPTDGVSALMFLAPWRVKMLRPLVTTPKSTSSFRLLTPRQRLRYRARAGMSHSGRDRRYRASIRSAEGQHTLSSISGRILHLNTDLLARKVSTMPLKHISREVSDDMYQQLCEVLEAELERLRRYGYEINSVSEYESEYAQKHFRKISSISIFFGSGEDTILLLYVEYCIRESGYTVLVVSDTSTTNAEFEYYYPVAHPMRPIKPTWAKSDDDGTTLAGQLYEGTDVIADSTELARKWIEAINRQLMDLYSF